MREAAGELPTGLTQDGMDLVAIRRALQGEPPYPRSAEGEAVRVPAGRPEGVPAGAVGAAGLLGPDDFAVAREGRPS
ncbi:hypothetical protein E4K10_30135 [Streptomyces sp. T1317-0309]|nr:hypothetical protein E4K10_30135 [Streptomyces sp. T1317-0309]